MYIACLVNFLTAVIFLPVVAVRRKLFEPSHGKNGNVAGSEKQSTVCTAQYQELGMTYLV
jgi:hypothetical protein